MSVLGRSPAWRAAAALVVASSVVSAGIVGCSRAPDSKSQDAAPSKVVLASTTSTQDSGLFDALIPAFEKADPSYKVDVIAVGTGEALKLGEQKDADVLLVHAKADEERFVEAGFGVERRDVAYNDFVIVGPEADPAGVKAASDSTAAIAALQSAGKDGITVFVARGDDSGTSKKELKLWKQAGIEPTPTPDADQWYLETGQGMGETLKIASEKAGYTLTDRATLLTMRDALDLVVLREGDEALLNQYGVIVVTGAKNQAGGQAFADWLLGPEGQKVIGEYGVEEFGQALFTPNAR